MSENVPVSINVRGKRADPSLWFREGTEIALGCSRCPEQSVCGGMAIQAEAFDCMDLCCGEPKTCRRYVCPNQSRYSKLVNEVGGFDLKPYRHSVSQMGTIPSYIPYLLDRGDIHGPLTVPVVALSLYSIIHHRTGVAKFHSRQELVEHFRLDPHTRVVITSTGKDRSVENFWHVLRLRKTAESISRLQPLLVATPNFSMHVDTVRHDNMLSMSRISYCFEAFAGAGLPVALHVNGRTPRDFARWADYLSKSPGIYAVSYELGTVGGSHTRRSWHVQKLAELASRVDRPLTLLLRAGGGHVASLAKSFSRVVLVDSTPHMKAKNRQSAFRLRGVLDWEKSPTAPGESIDALLLHNVRVCRRAIHANVPA